MAKKHLTPERLRYLLLYVPRTGKFYWRPAAAIDRNVRPWAKAGFKEGPYIRIGVDGRVYRANRLAVFYMTGKWPDHLVDHEDGDTFNNRWENLRQLTQGQNQQNLMQAKSNSKSGHLGVVWYARTGRWLASIGVDGVSHYLGYHKDLDSAIAAYAEAKQRLHPYSSRFN